MRCYATGRWKAKGGKVWYLHLRMRCDAMRCVYKYLCFGNGAVRVGRVAILYFLVYSTVAASLLKAGLDDAPGSAKVR